jgi:hypothetical protein
MGLSFTIAAGSRQRSNSQIRVPRDSRLHFTVSDSRFPQPGGRSPRIYIPQEQGGPVVPPGTGFPFHRLLRLAELRWRYWSPPPHWIRLFSFHYTLSIWYNTDFVENTAFNSSSIVACVFVTSGTCLQSRCLAMLIGTHKQPHKPHLVFFN